MTTLQLISSEKNFAQDQAVSTEQFVDMATIRRRIATIKNRWSPETIRARALEGARRRSELQALLADLLDEQAADEARDDSGFSLVG